MKIRVRIILLLSSTFASLILVFSIFVYVLSSNYVFNDFYDRLKTRTNTTIRIELDHSEDKKYVKQFKEEYLEKLPEEKSVIVKLDKELKPLIRSGNNQENEFIQKVIQSRFSQDRNDNILKYGVLYQAKDNKSYVVYTSAKNMYYTKYKTYLRGLLISMFLASIVLIIIVSLWLSKRLIKPISDLSKSIHRIGTENLNFRIENNQEGDELGELIRTMNNMLDRLETSFETQNNFISNASHELNTPLTSIIGQADLMLSKDRSSEDYKSALGNILEQAEKLNKKTKALLFLAQTGFDGKKMTIESLRIDELIFETMETVNRIIPGNKIKFDFESLPENLNALEVKGNSQLLQLALSNVLLNASKYSDNEDVRIYLSHTKESISIHVQDNGIGIPPHELSHIYDPFFRASNTTSFEGYGIGLPLTRNIMRQHHGKILVHSVEDIGTLLTLVIPYKS
ncbi:sensor histidine kinase [Fluviicola taffensis]|uniref:histidine kinase n=1 Tax=Fluviicola taffensis (strain DSM 16823 / NCIMB 13979 / RW262) TaxID=755732 RepID=F2IH38_FLUTR|nr:ATP-binding protein [Fluviicola taffensis]AEA45852.1 integral membrane sensor signal transduction histidine kinase [Fluviicola taffensis DSM 16823]